MYSLQSLSFLIRQFVPNTHWSIAAIILSFLPACNQYLEVTPTSVANVNAFYKTRQDAIVATTAIYNALYELHRESLWMLGEVQSDNTEDPSLLFDNFAFDAANSTVEHTWRFHYIGITRANTVLNRVPAISMETELKNRLLLEARFLRAWFYFNLVRLYGDVPLVTDEVTTLAQTSLARSPKENVYQQIIEDLTAAEALPIFYPPTEMGRVTRGTAKALLTYVYVTRREWIKAAAKAKEVIDMGLYSLLPTYADVFSSAHKNNKESIFEIQYVVGSQSGTGNVLSNNFFELFAPRGSGSMVTGIPNTNALGRNVPTNELVASYEFGDKRKEASLQTSYVQSGTPPQVIDVNYIIKYLDPTASAGGLGTGSSNSWRVIRYADILLLYAEALNEISPGNPEAFEALNMIRIRAGLSPLQLADLPNQAAFRMQVYRDRRAELAFENYRWFDLVRTGQALEKLKDKNIQIRNLLLPIPQRERNINPSLSQNTGY